MRDFPGPKGSVEGHLFGYISDETFRLQRLLRDIKHADLQPPGCRLNEIQEQIDEGRLAGAVCAQQAINVAGRYAERYAVQGNFGAKLLRYFDSFEHGCSFALIGCT